MSRIFISAARKSSGKTSVTIGLCAALHARGLAVQPFKKGPDYIDPHWLAKAAGRPCYNLDFYTMRRDEIADRFHDGMQGADIGIIEGNKGLYDGLALDGSNSNAALAKLLNAPVVLVLDARGMTRGIAPLILGNQAFDPEVSIAGVILNQLGGSRHEAKLRAVIEHYTDVPVLGAVARKSDMEILERHLGLIPSNEQGDADHYIEQIGTAIGAQVDLDALTALAADCSPPAAPDASPFSIAPPGQPLRIGIARDEAFGFYYPGDLEAMQNAGAELVWIDMLHDPRLPAVDGLFIGGGFPESSMRALQANHGMRDSVRAAIEAGLPTYAECGGLMYLCRSLRWRDASAAMVGVIGAAVVTMGIIALPAMLKQGYDPRLATGTIAASGTLGQIIPPSIVLIILADQLASAVDQAGTARQVLYKQSTGNFAMPSEFGVVSTSAGETAVPAVTSRISLPCARAISCKVCRRGLRTPCPSGARSRS